jgi:hypothetical protein
MTCKNNTMLSTPPAQMDYDLDYHDKCSLSMTKPVIAGKPEERRTLATIIVGQASTG